MNELLLNYGVLGAWTIYLLYEKRVLLFNLNKSIENNTDVLVELKNHFKKIKE